MSPDRSPIHDMKPARAIPADATLCFNCLRFATALPLETVAFFPPLYRHRMARGVNDPFGLVSGDNGEPHDPATTGVDRWPDDMAKKSSAETNKCARVTVNLGRVLNAVGFIFLCIILIAAAFAYALLAHEIGAYL